MKRFITLVISIAITLYTNSSLFAQSPYKISWEKDGYILGAGSATAAAGFLFYRSVSSPTSSEVNQLSRGSINWFDRNATYNYSEKADKTSDILYGVATVAPFALFTDKTMRDDWKTITLMYLETWSFIGGTSMLAKGTIERFRPFIYNPDVPLNKKLNSDAKMSFFSNHTATAFASAIFISTVYCDYNPDSELKPYIWAGSLIIAGTVGFLRYEAGAHFPTDIIAGAILGSAIGYGIPWMHRIGEQDVSVIPYAPYAEYGLTVQVKF